MINSTNSLGPDWIEIMPRKPNTKTVQEQIQQYHKTVEQSAKEKMESAFRGVTHVLADAHQTIERNKAQISSLSSNNSQLSASVKSLTAVVKQKDEMIQQQEKEYGNVLFELTLQDTESKKVKRQNNELSTKTVQQANAIGVLKVVRNVLTQQCTNLQATNNQLTTQNGILQVDLNERSAQKIDLEEKVERKRVKIGNLQAANNQLTTQNGILQVDLNERSAQKIDLEEKVERKRVKIGNLRADALQKLEASIVTLNNEMVLYSNEIATSLQRLEILKQHANQQAEVLADLKRSLLNSWWGLFDYMGDETLSTELFNSAGTYQIACSKDDFRNKIKEAFFVRRNAHLSNALWSQAINLWGDQTISAFERGFNESKTKMDQTIQALTTHLQKARNCKLALTQNSCSQNAEALEQALKAIRTTLTATHHLIVNEFQRNSAFQTYLYNISLTVIDLDNNKVSQSVFYPTSKFAKACLFQLHYSLERYCAELQTFRANHLSFTQAA